MSPHLGLVSAANTGLSTWIPLTYHLGLPLADVLPIPGATVSILNISSLESSSPCDTAEQD